MIYEVWKTNELGMNNLVRVFTDLPTALAFIKECQQTDFSNKYWIV